MEGSSIKLHDAAFYAAFLFLVGVAAGSAGITPLVLLIFLFVFFLAGFLLRKRFGLPLAALFYAPAVFFFGYFYFHLFAVIDTPRIPQSSFEALISRDPKRGDSQEITLTLLPPASGTVVFYAPRHPAYHYGDVLKFNANAELNKYHGRHIIYGKAELVQTGRGSMVRSVLYKIKRSFVSVFESILDREKAALLAGITVGERGEFSSALNTALRLSGTMHITALSGYNIAILVFVMGRALSRFLSPRQRFFATIFAIASFVIMTGAESSVVRAGIMGGIALLARQSGRIYSMRNSVTLTAFIMTLFEPYVLVDIGFQLSFLSLLGIVLLSPAIEDLLRRTEGRYGIVIPEVVREAILATLAAQLAVAPILLLHFGTFSPIALVANVLVLGIMPVTMTLGFALGIAGIISLPLAWIFAPLVEVVLSYMLAIIKVFGSLAPYLSIEYMPSLLFATIYYALLIFVIWASKQKTKDALSIKRS
jgi:ComEC/Rec2-related protein